MKVKIILDYNTQDEQYYKQFYGKIYEVLEYDELYGCFTLPIPSPQGDKTTYWYHGEVEIVEQ